MYTREYRRSFFKLISFSLFLSLALFIRFYYVTRSFHKSLNRTEHGCLFFSFQSNPVCLLSTSANRIKPQQYFLPHVYANTIHGWFVTETRKKNNRVIRICFLRPRKGVAAFAGNDECIRRLVTNVLFLFKKNIKILVLNA